MPYQKPKVGKDVIDDFEEVLKTTLNKPDKVSFYAFHGVKSEISMSITFLKNRDRIPIQDGYLQRLQELEAHYKWDYS